VWFCTVKVLEPIRAPHPMNKELASKWGLKKKYGEQFEHIDKIFWRYPHPLGFQGMFPRIDGSTFYGSLKEAMGKGGEPMSFPKIFGVYFNEHSVTLDARLVTLKGNKETLSVVEVILPGEEGMLIMAKEPKPEKLPIMLVLGGRKKRGYGTITIEWQKAVKTGQEKP